MKGDKMMFCKAALSGGIRDGRMPLYAISKFIRHFRGSPDASEIARITAGRLADLRQYRLSAVFYMHGGDNAAAAAQLRTGGMYYPAVYNLLLAGKEGEAFRLAERIAGQGNSRVQGFFDTMSSRAHEADMLLSDGKYADAVPSLLSFMLMREATGCAEMLEQGRPYQALDTYLMTGMLSAAFEVFFSTMGTALRTKGAADPRAQALELMGFSAQSLSDSCLRRELHFESATFNILGLDFLTLLGEAVEVMPDMGLRNPLAAGRMALEKGNAELALELGKKMEEMGLHLSAAEIYGEMGQLPLQAANLALAGEFERANEHRLSMERKATAREA